MFINNIVFKNNFEGFVVTKHFYFINYWKFTTNYLNKTFKFIKCRHNKLNINIFFKNNTLYLYNNIYIKSTSVLNFYIILLKYTLYNPLQLLTVFFILYKYIYFKLLCFSLNFINYHYRSGVKLLNY